MEQGGKIRVYIVAPAPAMRAGLGALLQDESFLLVGDAPSFSARSALPPLDVVILTEEGLLASEPGAIPPSGSLGLVLLSDDTSSLPLLRSLPLLGWALLPMDAPAPALRAASVAVAQGLVLLPATLAGQLLGQLPRIESLPEPLTPREQEVLQQLSQGMSNRQIARVLQISEHTVKFHISSIFGKLGAASRTEAVSIGARQGLITL